MSKISFIVLLIISTFTLTPFLKPVFAAGDCKNIGVTSTIEPFPIPENTPSVSVTFNNTKDAMYRLRFDTIIPGPTWLPGTHIYIPQQGVQASNSKVTITIDQSSGKLKRGNYKATLEIFENNTWGDYCQNFEYEIGYSIFTCKLSFFPFNPTDAEQIRVNVSTSIAGEYQLFLNGNDIRDSNNQIIKFNVDNSGTGTVVIGPISPPVNKAKLQAVPSKDAITFKKYGFCSVHNFTVKASGTTQPRPVPSATLTPGAPSGLPSTGHAGPNVGHAAGIECRISIGGTAYDGVATAIGCIPTDPVGLIRASFRFMLSIGGGVAFLLIIMAIFQMMTSAGNPNTLKEGAEKLTNAVIGILFIVFSVLLFQIIGVGILNIPGFR